MGAIRWRTRSGKEPSPSVVMPPDGSQPRLAENRKIIISPNQNVGSDSAIIAPIVAR